MSSEAVAVKDHVQIREALISVLESFDATTDPDAVQAAVIPHGALTQTAVSGSVTWAVGQLLDALIYATQWRAAQRAAEPDATRFATAAALRASDVVAQQQESWPVELRDAAALLDEVHDAAAVTTAAKLLAAVPIAPHITDLLTTVSAPRYGWFERQEDDPTPTVALLIRLHDEPVLRPTIVVPDAMHRFEIEARVSTWPADAERLVVSFASTYPPDYLFASTVSFARDALIQPLDLRVAGTRPPEDPPLEITAQASMEGDGAPSRARLVGNTTLELSTFDSASSLLANLPAAGRRLQQMMSELTNALPDLQQQDRQDVQLLFEGALRFAHTVLDDRLDAHADGDVDEAWFQAQLKAFLQADPRIGARLGERVGRAGGITDLVLGNIVLELKFENKTALTLESAGHRYAGQATQYGSAGDSQVSLLAVLDVSPKRAPAGVMGNEVGWVRPVTASGPDPALPSLVGVVVVRGGFLRPSDLSRYLS